MTTQLKPFPSVPRAIRNLILELPVDGGVPTAQVGGDFRFDAAKMPWYVRIDRVGGQAGQIQGTQVVDIEVFSRDYLVADSLAFALDALVLGYPHVVEVDGRKVVLDEVYQNSGPADLPWGDDSVFRIGATYSITVRRH